jgi:translocation and assembly module TamA
LPAIAFIHRLFFVFLLLSSSVLLADPIKLTVKINGVDASLGKTLLNGLSIEKQKESERLNKRYLEKLHKSAPEELRTMLTVFGYYQPEISSELSFDKDNWQATYTIDLGEPVKLVLVDVVFNGEAAEDAEFIKLKKAFPLQKDQQLNHQQYEAAKKSILTLGVSRGYFDGKLTQASVEVDVPNHIANVYLHYDSGVRYRFGKTLFPDTVVGEPLLDRLLPYKEGEPYLDNKALTLRKNLSNSGYFDSVSVRTQRAERQDGQVPIDISLEEKPKQLYTAGLGYGTDTGARLSLGWENRYVNKRGHRLQADARLSQVTNTLSADYVMPFWSETINTVGFNTEYKQQDTDTSESESFAIGSYYKRERWGWDETGSIKFLQEDFDISDESESTFLLIPGISWSRTWADNTIYTKHGARLSLTLSGASESFLSDITFGQIVVRGKLIQAFGENSRFITRGSIGATEVSDFERLPSSLRFFTGGDNSIRGFDYQSLGPENSEGDVVGGRYLAVGSVELEHMFLKDWGAAVFSDFGNAFNSFSDPIEYSVGVGIRWRSPVGLIRVDLAKGLSEKDEPIALHIVIGPDL